MTARSPLRGGIALLVGALGLGACASGTDVTGDLTQAEAAQLLTALSSIYLPNPGAPPTPTAAAARAPQREPVTSIFTYGGEITINCAAGGTAVVADADTISVTTDVRFEAGGDTSYVSSTVYTGRTVQETRYLGCAARDGQGGVWTFDVDPGLTLLFDQSGETLAYALTGGTTYSSTTAEWEGLWSGTLNWRNGGRSGDCDIHVEMSSSTTIVGQSVTYSFGQEGEICGLSVSASSSSGT